MITSLLLPLMQAAPARDTIVTVAARDSVDFIYALAAGAVMATFLGLLLAIVVVLFQVKKAGRALDEARRRIAADRGVESLRKIADNMADVSRSLRNDVGKVSDSVTVLSERVTQVSNRMEERVEEFNALMEVVQEEAESAFVDSASTARGVRVGVGNLRRRARGRAQTRLGEHASEARSEGDPSTPPSRSSLPAGSGGPAPDQAVEAGRTPKDGKTAS